MSFTEASKPASLQLGAMAQPLALTCGVLNYANSYAEAPLAVRIDGAIGVLMPSDNYAVGHQSESAKMLWRAYDIPHLLPSRRNGSAVDYHRHIVQPLFQEMVVPRIRDEIHAALKPSKYAIERFDGLGMRGVHLPLAARFGIVDPEFVLREVVPSMKAHANRVEADRLSAFEGKKDFLGWKYQAAAFSGYLISGVSLSLAHGLSGSYASAAGFVLVQTALALLNFKNRPDSKRKAQEGLMYAQDLEDTFKTLVEGREDFGRIGPDMSPQMREVRLRQFEEFRIIEIEKNPKYAFNMLPLREPEDAALLIDGQARRIVVARDLATGQTYIRMLAMMKSGFEGELSNEELSSFDNSSTLVSQETLVGAATISMETSMNGEEKILLTDVFDPAGELVKTVEQKVGPIHAVSM